MYSAEQVDGSRTLANRAVLGATVEHVSKGQPKGKRLSGLATLWLSRSLLLFPAAALVIAWLAGATQVIVAWLALFLVMGVCIASLVRARDLLDPVFLFVTLLTVFHFGLIGIEVLTDPRSPHLAFYGVEMESAITAGVALAALGVLVFWLGTTFLDLRDGQRRGSKACDSRVRPTLGGAAVSTTLGGVAVLATGYGLHEEIAAVWSAGYAASLRSGSGGIVAELSRLAGPFAVVFGFSLILLARGRGPLAVLGIAYVVGFTLLQAAAGSRAAALLPIIGVLWLWDKKVRRISRPKLIVAACLAIGVALPAVREMRESSSLSSENMSAPSVIGAGSTVAEAGRSIRTFVWTLQDASYYDLAFPGETYARGVMTPFPNIFWSVHPAFAKSTATQSLAAHIAPKYETQPGGFGYSVFAEAYLNAGYHGYLFVVVGVGLMLRLVLGSANTRSYPTDARALMIALAIAFLFILPRAEFITITRSLAWYVVLPAAIWTLRERSRRRRRKPNLGDRSGGADATKT